MESAASASPVMRRDTSPLHEHDDHTTGEDRAARSGARSSRRTAASDTAGPEDEEPDVPALPATLAWYQRELEQHLARTQQRWQGTRKREFRPSRIGGERWSGREKALFFGALARHSRWRPDLIAAAVGKPEFAVQRYLAQLEQGRHAVRVRRVPDDSAHVVEVPARFVAREEGFAGELLRLARPPPAPKADWGADLRGRLGALHAALESSVKEAPVDDDEATIARIEAVPKAERGDADRTLLRHLLNRRRNRTAYRRKILRGEGLTDAQIAAGGGVDAIFEREQEAKARAKRAGARRRTAEELLADRRDADARELLQLGAARELRQKGLDVLNFQTLAGWLGEAGASESEPRAEAHEGEAQGERREGEPQAGDSEGGEQEQERGGGEEAEGGEQQQQGEAAQRDAPPSLSVPVLSHLYASMLAYLTPLIYQSVVIGEAQVRQQRQAPGELTAAHVRAALRLRDELPSSEPPSVLSHPAPSHASTPSALSPLRPASPLSPGPRPELALPTWADFPPPITPSRPVTREGTHRTSFSSHTTAHEDPLPAFSVAHEAPNYQDEGTDEEDVVIDAALRRYHKSADRAYDKRYADALGHVAGEREAGRARRKREAKLDAAERQAEKDWEKYERVRESMLERRARRRAQLRKYADDARRAKRRKLRHHATVSDASDEDEPGPERRVSDDIIGTTDDEDEDEPMPEPEPEPEPEGEDEIDDFGQEDELEDGALDDDEVEEGVVDEDEGMEEGVLDEEVAEGALDEHELEDIELDED